MNDFDFEELDKAVSALESKTQEEHGGLEPDEVPTAQVLAISKPSVPPAPLLSAEEPKPVKQASGTKPEAVPAPAKRVRLTETLPHSRGAFMDIVPPATRKSASRVGASLQPVSGPEGVVPERPHEAIRQSESKGLQADEAAKSEVMNDREPELAKPVPVRPSDDVAWPDPFDFRGDTPDEPKEEAKSEPAASPFLTEAKVEKRPLGAFSSFGNVNESKSAGETSEPKPETAPVVDELTPDKDGTFEEPKPEKPPATEESEVDKKPSKSDMHSAAMMSIPQQYRTETKTADTSTRPVFDTKEYHPPLLESAVHERHGSSMWGKIFIALVVLALLAVAGYFAYLYIVR